MNNLLGIGELQPGVGDGDDLSVVLREAPSGEWYPSLRRGYYYLNDRRRYLYSRPETSILDVQDTPSDHSIAVAEDPTRLGPIRVSREDTDLRRVCSPLRAFREVETETDGDYQIFTVPGVPVLLVADPRYDVFSPVTAKEDIVSTRDYHYDPITSVVTLRDPEAPALYVSYLVDETDSGHLLQEEIVAVDTDLQVRVQIGPVSTADGLKPVIRKIGSSSIVEVVADGAAGNVISIYSDDPTDTPIVAGDLVAVSYYVEDSYTARWDSGSLILEVLSAETGEHTLTYETGGEYYETALLDADDSNAVQLNPLWAARRSGFLYLLPEGESAIWPDPVRVTIDLSNSAPLLFGTVGEPVMAAIHVTDGSGDPIPNVLLSVDVTGVDGTLAQADGTSSRTDGSGNALYRFTPEDTGDAQVTVEAGEVSTSVDFTVRASTLYSDAAELRLGKLLLHLESTPYRNGLYRLSAMHCLPDGAPYHPSTEDVEVAGSSGSVAFSATKSRFFNLDGVEIARPAGASLSADGVAHVLVEPQPGDTLRAQISLTTDAGERVRRARPIRIPEA